jgi:hypothetical protein
LATKEWVKIETQISNEFYNLYILKEIVNSARNLRPDYLNNKTKDNAIAAFKQDIYDSLNKIAKFCIPKNLNYEKLLCSLLILARNIEGILYAVISTRMHEKQKE